MRVTNYLAVFELLGDLHDVSSDRVQYLQALPGVSEVLLETVVPVDHLLHPVHRLLQVLRGCLGLEGRAT